MAPGVPLAWVIMKTRRSLSIVALLFASACSGATSTELFDQVGQESIPAAPIVGQDDPTSSGSSSSGGTSGSSSSSSSSSSSTSSSSGASGTPQPGAPDAGPPAPACVVEAEPNDGPAETNWFTSCFSGSLKRDDNDYASVNAPLAAKRVEIKTKDAGDVRYRIYINGVAYQAGSDDMPDFVPVFGGATYSFEMSAEGGGGAKPYELTVAFE